MAANLSRSGTQKTVPIKEAKAEVIRLIQEGMEVAPACALVGRKEETYRSWRKTDPAFKAAVDQIRASNTEIKKVGRPEVPDFPTFCRDYLFQPLNIHQLRILDVIEGREPRDLHESMTFSAGYDNRVLVNVPPEHAKSTTFTVNYVVWLIHKNPDIRVVIVSQGRALAQDFLYEIKLKLTSPLYREMHQKFAPEHGWKDKDGAWTTDRIYVKGKNENGTQKDPTVQAMGLKGTIYGKRADLIIVDDAVSTKNANEIDIQYRILSRDIESRLPSDQEGGGLLLVLGTRVAPMDLYKHLLSIEDADERPVWTYFRQPAVLDYGTGDSATWTTLWPAKWNGPSLARRRRDASWNLFYQQLDVTDDMTFKVDAVNASINKMRFPGLNPFTNGPGAREGGMSGLYVVCGLDPAATGNTAIVVAALERDTNKRYVIDGWNKTNASAEDIINQIKFFTELYQPHEWVIEKNGLQRFITQLPEIVDFLRARGCRVTPHHTTENKFDADWGIQTMGPLFDSCVEPDPKNENVLVRAPRDRHLIELPSARQNAWVNDLIQQLTIWQPEGMAQKAKTDLVMALWFTHIAFMAQLHRKPLRQTHLNTPFTSPAARKRQGVINLAAARQQKRMQEGVA